VVRHNLLNNLISGYCVPIIMGSLFVPFDLSLDFKKIIVTFYFLVLDLLLFGLLLSTYLCCFVIGHFAAESARK
jgi:hypothetical protein